MSETELSAELRSMREAVKNMEVSLHIILGTRLTREQYAARRGESLATFDRANSAGKIPPSKDGKWLVADVIEWESGK